MGIGEAVGEEFARGFVFVSSCFSASVARHVFISSIHSSLWEMRKREVVSEIGFLDFFFLHFLFFFILFCFVSLLCLFDTFLDHNQW